MKKKVAIRLPKIYNAKGDITKKWFVFFSVPNSSGFLERVRKQGNINQYTTYDEKLIAAEKLKVELTNKLKSGWNPLDANSNEEVIYYDSLAPAAIKLINNGEKKSIKDISYYLSEFAASLDTLYTDSTRQTYQSKLRTYQLWLKVHGYGEYEVHAVDINLISKFFKHLIDERKISKKSVNKYRQQLDNFYEWLENKGIIYKSPLNDTLPTTDRIVDKAARPIPERYLKLLAPLVEKDLHLSLATKLEYYCAIRPGEMRLIKLKDIDLDSGIIRISSTVGKNNNVESITMASQLIKFLESNFDINNTDPEYYLFGKYGEPGPFQIGKNRLAERYKVIRIKAGVPAEYKMYGYKHTAAVRLIKDKENPKDIKFIQRHFRHSHISTTDIYMRKMTSYETESLKDEFPDL